jgi:hypothetical protein
MNTRAVKWALLACPALAVSVLAGAVNAATFTVETTVDDIDAPDATPGDGICADAFGFCTLRAAVEEANARAGIDAIEFSVAGEFDLVIGPLPTITETLIIDGRTAPGYNTGGTTLADSRPVVTLDGSALAGSSPDGLRFSGSAAADSEVRALSIVGFPDNGIEVASGADGLRVEGCFIGLSPSGAARGNGGDGILAFGSDGLVIGRIYGFFTSEFLELGNAAGANAGIGINLLSVNDSTLFGNLVGVDPLGGGLRGNAGSGIEIVGNGNVVGATDADENAGNVIVDNGGNGLLISGSSNQVLGNRIGVLAGVPGAGNVGDGIVVLGTGNQVGSAEPRNGNHVSGNDVGIRIGRGAVAGSSTRVRNNEIGDFGSGVGNTSDGIVVERGTINEISFNRIVNNGGTGVSLDDSSNIVTANEIGVGGDVPAGNASHGVRIDVSTTGNLVGGPDAENGNVIGANGASGSLVAGILAFGQGHTLRNNFVGVTRSGADVGNAREGIRVFAEGVVIEDNRVGFNADAGISVSVEGSTLRNNWIGALPGGQVAGNSGGGVVVGGLDQTIGPGNRIFHNGGAGISALSGTGNLAAFDNDIADHPADGIVLIDATAYVAGNRIRYNRNGVTVFANSSVQVVANSMHSNLFLGIDLDGDGATSNDPGDADGGPNLTMNHPELLGADFLPAMEQVEVMFRVDSVPANHGYPLRIDAYATDRNEPIQGRYWLGFVTYVSAGVTETAIFDLPEAFYSGGLLSLTATDIDGNTSELSPSLLFGQIDAVFRDGFEFP